MAAYAPPTASPREPNASGNAADIKTMAALGVFATTAVTAVTAQNTTAVREVHYVPTDMVDAQIDAVLNPLKEAVLKLDQPPK